MLSSRFDNFEFFNPGPHAKHLEHVVGAVEPGAHYMQSRTSWYSARSGALLCPNYEAIRTCIKVRLKTERR